MIFTAIPSHRITETFRRRPIVTGDLLCVLVPKMNGRGGNIAVAIEANEQIKSLHWHENIASAWEAFDVEYEARKEKEDERAADANERGASKNNGRNRKRA